MLPQKALTAAASMASPRSSGAHAGLQGSVARTAAHHWPRVPPVATHPWAAPSSCCQDHVLTAVRVSLEVRAKMGRGWAGMVGTAKPPPAPHTGVTFGSQGWKRAPE